MGLGVRQLGGWVVYFGGWEDGWSRLQMIKKMGLQVSHSSLIGVLGD